MIESQKTLLLAPSPVAARRGLTLVTEWRHYVVYAGFVVIFAAFAFALHDRGFLQPNNLLNIARQTAIIAISGQPDWEKRILQAGADSFMAKPLDLEKLQTEAKRLLRIL